MGRTDRSFDASCFPLSNSTLLAVLACLAYLTKQAKQKQQLALAASSHEVERQQIENAYATRVRMLERELLQTKAQLEEQQQLHESDHSALENEQRLKDAKWKRQVETLTLELNGIVARMGTLGGQLRHFSGVNDSLKQEIETMTAQHREQDELFREQLSAKDAEIAALNKELEASRTKDQTIRELTKEVELARTMAAAAVAAATSCLPPTVELPSLKKDNNVEEAMDNNAEQEMEENMKKQVSTNEQRNSAEDAAALEAAAAALARLQALHEEETLTMKRQAAVFEAQADQYKQQYVEMSKSLEETQRKNAQLQELANVSSEKLNLEYVKNVVIKYMETQSPADRERLVPVIATMLQFR